MARVQNLFLDGSKWVLYQCLLDCDYIAFFSVTIFCLFQGKDYGFFESWSIFAEVRFDRLKIHEEVFYIDIYSDNVVKIEENWHCSIEDDWLPVFNILVFQV